MSTTTETLTIDHDADLDAILEALQAHDLTEEAHHADALATTVAARYALRRAEQWPTIVSCCDRTQDAWIRATPPTYAELDALIGEQVMRLGDTLAYNALHEDEVRAWQIAGQVIAAARRWAEDTIRTEQVVTLEGIEIMRPAAPAVLDLTIDFRDDEQAV